jgi:hypothetical protein
MRQTLNILATAGVMLWSCMALGVAARKTMRVSATSCAEGGPYACSAALSAAFNACSGVSGCSVVLDPNTVYNVATPNYASIIYAYGATLENFTFEGSGSVLLSSSLSAFLNLGGGTNVTLRNFVLDMVRVPYTLATCIGEGSTNSSVTMSYNPSLYPPPGNANESAWMNAAQAVLGWNVTDNRPADGAVDIYILSDAAPVTWGPCGANATACTFELALPASQVPVGGAYVVRHQVYSYNGVAANGIAGLEVSNVTIWTTPGMGLVAGGSTGVLVDGLRVMRKAGYAMSATADGLHLTSCRGGDVVVQNSVFEGQGDDGGNIPSRYWEIEQFLSPDRTTLQCGRLLQPVALDSMAAGDTLRFYNRTTFAVIGTATVASFNGSQLTLTAPAPAAVGVYDLLVDVDAQPRSVTLRNNTYASNRARGHLLKASNVLVTNCTFSQMSGAAIQVDPDGVYWFEGDVVFNWTVQDTVIYKPNYGPAMETGDIFLAAFAPAFADGKPTQDWVQIANGVQHGNVTIRNVSFTRSAAASPASSAVDLNGVNGVSVLDSTIAYDAAAALPPTDITFAHSLGVTQGGNTCPQRPGGSCVVQQE